MSADLAQELSHVRVLITGANGFLGSRLVAGLLGAGHELVCAVRRPGAARSGGAHLGDASRCEFVQVDFSRDTDPAVWRPRLQGVDAVINAVGIFREGQGQRFDTIHDRTPSALFTACLECGVSRVVQISALGADDQASSSFHLSKKAADDHLLSLALPSAVVAQPSLVYGPGGTSARWFETMASLPLIALPGGGRQPVQPIHVDDLVQAVVALVHGGDAAGRVPLVGPHPLQFREMLAALRRGMGLGSPRFLSIPAGLMALAARAGDRVPASPIDSESWAMLERGNTGDAAAITGLLGRPPRPVEQFVEPASAPAVAQRALLGWLLPLLRWSLAVMWIVTGIVSLWVYPVADSLALLEQAGVPEVLRPLALWGAALLDITLGIAILVWRQRIVWLAQILLVLTYTAIISVKLPEFWAHPYGPVLKNLPLLAAFVLLHQLEQRTSGKPRARATPQ
jgi:uncharacterized protein YbjT (DUF2867 family)